MMDDAAIRVHRVSKTFKLPHEKHTSIKGLFINLFKSKRTYEKQQVLNDISFEIKKGEFFGIVGRNGSGKSTLLKLLAGIYTPDSGTIHINGKLTPFIELGVGFNPELTGRENVFLNGALLGFNRKEMESMYQEIVDFAELDKFMDQKLKNYSSGMQVRLAFSIAIRAKSDILLLDEVLAVGDEAFQKKCLAVFEKYKANKQTVILVTHNMAIVEMYCDRAIMLNNGDIINSGEPRKVAHQYSRMNTDSYIEFKEKEQKKKEKRKKLDQWNVKIEVLNAEGKKTNAFSIGDTAKIRVKWSNNQIKNLGIAFLTQSGEYVFGANTILDKHTIKNNQVEYNLSLNVGAGDYEFKLGLFGEKETETLEFIDDGPKIFVKPFAERSWEGIANLEHKWK